MRTEQETNSINRILKARGLPTLDHPGVVSHLAGMVVDHRHFMELLRVCEPVLRRQMYEAMRPHLRFRAWPLESYIIAAIEQAAQLPTVDAAGEIHPHTTAVLQLPEVEIPEVELMLECSQCGKQSIYCEETDHDAKREARLAGWIVDETVEAKHVCPNCGDKADAS